MNVLLALAMASAAGLSGLAGRPVVAGYALVFEKTHLAILGGSARVSVAGITLALLAGSAHASVAGRVLVSAEGPARSLAADLAWQILPRRSTTD